MSRRSPNTRDLGTETSFSPKTGSAWMDTGLWKLPGRYTLAELQPVIERWDGTGWGPCSRCGTEINKDDAAQHFAGRYCDFCWEEYKDEHDWICKMCGQPAYRCHC